MPFNINDFMTNIQQYGVSSTSKFDVNISLPKIFTNTQNSSILQSELPRLLSLRAEHVNLPVVALLSNETSRYGLGPMVKQPYNAVFGDIKMTFIADKNGSIYTFFYSWINSIYNFAETSTTSGTSTVGSTTTFTLPRYTTMYDDDVVSPKIDINIYDNTGALIQTAYMTRAKPIMFAASPLSWEQTNNLFKITVGFTFKEWALAVAHKELK